MSIKPEGIHFLLTYRCTYACDHCFLWGSPEQEGTMTCAQVTSVIDQAAAHGSVSMVYFEGGEPTLVYPVMLAAARHARENGLDFGVVTNCHFAESPEDAALWFAPLKELGIADLSLSSYAYFLAGEQERLLRNAVVAARDLELPLAVLEVGADADLSDIGVPSEGCSAVMYKGRAAVELAPDQADAEHGGQPPAALTECPYEDFAAPERGHVGCDGEFQLCQGISAGNVWKRGLADVFNSCEPAAMPVVGDILRGGPYELARAHGVQPARERYADACHLCYETRLRLRDALPAHPDARPSLRGRRVRGEEPHAVTQRAVGEGAVLGPSELRRRRPLRQEEVPPPHLRRSQEGRQDRVCRRSRLRRHGGRQGLP